MIAHLNFYFENLNLDFSLALYHYEIVHNFLSKFSL